MAYVPPHRRKQQQASAGGGGASAGAGAGEHGPTKWKARHQQGPTSSRNQDHRSSSSNQRFDSSNYHVQRRKYDNTTTIKDYKNKDDHISLEQAFHRICCINLDTRIDKWNLIQKDAGKVSKTFQQQIERISAVEGNKIFLNHNNNSSSSSSSPSRREEEEEELRYDETTCTSSCNDSSKNDCNVSDISFHWDGSLDAKYNRHGRPGPRTITPSEAGCSLSHIKLWKQLAEIEPTSTTNNNNKNNTMEGSPATAEGNYYHQKDNNINNNFTMLILEDDARFSHVQGRSRFAKAFAKAWKLLPEDWGFLYLGLSSRGERTWLEDETKNEGDVTGDTTTMTSSSSISTSMDRVSNPPVRLYKPEYGYHTHAYAINRKTAQILVQNLPVCGPIDVWLADNQWFSLPVYCAVIAGEGWQLDDGTYEGNDLIIQERRGITNDIEHCS